MEHAVAKVVRSHLALMFSLEKQDTFYILSSEQSIELIKRAPHLIGHDPIILVYDLLPLLIENPGVIVDFGSTWA